MYRDKCNNKNSAITARANRERRSWILLQVLNLSRSRRKNGSDSAALVLILYRTEVSLAVTGCRLFHLVLQWWSAWQKLKNLLIKDNIFPWVGGYRYRIEIFWFYSFIFASLIAVSVPVPVLNTGKCFFFITALTRIVTKWLDRDLTPSRSRGHHSGGRWLP